jgi:molybdopterin molybdotransferase
MISVAEAQAQLIARIAQLPKAATEIISIMESVGRILASDVLAMRDHPPFPASAMDGYAVRWPDVEKLPATLRIIGESHAGQRFLGAVKAGDAVRIFTGAPVPGGADTIIIQEETSRDGDLITITGAPDKVGGHIRNAGLDALKGQTLVRTGEKLTAARAGLIAASAVSAVEVTVKPRVDLVLCGDELRLPGQSLGEDQIVSTNGLMLGAMLREAGADVIGDDHIVPDDKQALIAIFRNSTAQLIVSAGGASVGARDFIQDAIIAAGGTIDFWKIAMRPGKPLMLGSLNDKLILGLPGNPVSAYVGAILFALPAVRALQGALQILPETISANWTHDWSANGARTDFVRVQVERRTTGLAVRAVAMQDSSMLSVLAGADGLAIIEAGAAAVRAGDPVQILMLN